MTNEILRLNLGSGPKYIDGFINIDKSVNIILSRIKILKKILHKLNLIETQHLAEWDKRIIFKDVKKIKFKSETVHYIYTSHFLEHLYMWEAEAVLQHCYSILKKNGILRIVLPDLSHFIKEFNQLYPLNPVKASLDFNISLLSHPIAKTKKILGFIQLSDHIHKWHPTKELVINILKNVGFQVIDIQDYRKGKFEHLDKIEFISEASFYIEAVK